MWAHTGVVEGEEVCAEGCFEIMYGGNGMCAEPGLDIGQRRDALDLHAHGRPECDWKSERCTERLGLGLGDTLRKSERARRPWPPGWANVGARSWRVSRGS